MVLLVLVGAFSWRSPRLPATWTAVVLGALVSIPVWYAETVVEAPAAAMTNLYQQAFVQQVLGAAVVEEIALLARLHLDSGELERMQSELGAILEHFAALAQVDTTDVQPMTHAVPMELRLRPDDVAPSLSVEDALRGAPAKQDSVFVVPAIIGSGDAE